MSVLSECTQSVCPPNEFFFFFFSLCSCLDGDGQRFQEEASGWREDRLHLGVRAPRQRHRLAVRAGRHHAAAGRLSRAPVSVRPASGPEPLRFLSQKALREQACLENHFTPHYPPVGLYGNGFIFLTAHTWEFAHLHI